MLTWIRRHPLVAIGSLPAVLEAWRWLRRALEWGEHTEFIIHRFNDLKKGWDVIVEAPWWINMPLIFAGGLLIWWDLRRQRTQTAMVSTATLPIPIPVPEVDHRQWFAGSSIGQLGDEKLLRIALEALDRCREIDAKIVDMNAEIDALRPTNNIFEMSNPDSTEVAEAKKRRAPLIAEYHHAENDRVRAFNLVVEDLYGRFQDGRLVARAYLLPIKSDSEEVEIPSSRWRFLKFNADFTEASGEGITYRGIAVARN